MMRDLKGPDLFIDALAKASEQTRRALTAVMVGDGEDLPRYIDQAARLGLKERITFRAAMPARQAFALARTVVVPSRAEALPYIVLEALAAAKPMIASAVGGIPEIFGAGFSRAGRAEGRRDRRQDGGSQPGRSQACSRDAAAVGPPAPLRRGRDGARRGGRLSPCAARPSSNLINRFKAFFTASW